MDSLQTAMDLAERGYFSKALRELDESQATDDKKVSVDVQKAILLERVGQLEQSRTLLARLGKSRATTPSQRSLCEFTLGRIAWEEGERKSAFDHYRRAIALAEAVPNPTQKCWPAISLLAALSDSSDPGALGEMLSEIRWEVLKLGNAHVLTALHAHIASMEAKRGLFNGAKSHLRRASELLATAPNVYLEALVELSTAVIALLTLEFETAGIHA